METKRSFYSLITYDVALTEITYHNKDGTY